jgi:hypothetical protein
VESLTLEVETQDGVFRRMVMPASLLASDVPRGQAAEEATRGAAAHWGLPDFIFRPRVQTRGSGSREVGDAIVVVGDRAASVQVKSRLMASSDQAKERSWLDKRIAEGARQAAGTIRSLKKAAQMVLDNERGRSIAIAASDKVWLKVVVIDHPGLSNYLPVVDAVVLLRRDWEFLFQQLKSTYAVLEYIHRVSAKRPVALGDEPVRYYQLAAADVPAPQQEQNPKLKNMGAYSKSVPLLPQAPAGHGDHRHHVVVRMVLEDLAVTGKADEKSRLEVLAAIDAIPVAYRAELGKDILRWMGEVAAVTNKQITWKFRSMVWPDRPYLVFGATDRFTKTIQTDFSDYVTLRHQQLLELAPERGGMMTVGVLLTRRLGNSRLWDTTITAARGEQGFDAKIRPALEMLWGPFGASVQDYDWNKIGAVLSAADLKDAQGIP